MVTKFVSERNLKFLLYEVFDVAAFTHHSYYMLHKRKTFDMVLSETLRIARNLMWPCLEDMDRHPPELVDMQVRVHPSVKPIMREVGQGGWIGASFPSEFDGEQLPITVASACRFIFFAANYSAGVYPELTTGAARLIISFGSPELIATYVPRMLKGEWQGTMALTEPAAGSSLSDITTYAVPTKNEDYRIQGQKIFISAGDHDGVDNVVHLMLAKIEGAPPGVKGISLFVVPKKRPDSKGALVDNDIAVSQVYHKLGYRGTPIVELSIGDNNDCHGYLVGEPHKGMIYMFQMMNEARIGVGLGAAAIASAAYYAALDYARERPQGRKPNNKDPLAPPVAIIEHADVKRMLLFQRAVFEGALSLLLQCSVYADKSLTTKGSDKRKWDLLLDILTPVAKSYPSEMGIFAVSQALQCFGGYGYCQDFPVEQYFRDMRIHPIHEGTTGIQGIDLLGRKVRMEDGYAYKLLLEEIRETISACRRLADLNTKGLKLEKALVKLDQVTQYLTVRMPAQNPEFFLADATLYLDFFGIVTIAWQWLLQAIKAERSLKSHPSISQTNFYQGKLYTAAYFFSYELPKIEGLAARLLDNDPVTVNMNPEYFND
ncbi:acyl-CoA dehydrogenase [bacterium]|nr:acyl-CoA dehydrogenase [bacterium]